MKRKSFRTVIAVCLVLALAAVGFAGCGGNGTPAADPGSSGVSADQGSASAGSSGSASVGSSGASADAAATGAAEAIPGAADGEKFEFTFAYSTTPTSATGQSYEYFASQLEKYSGGSITTELYPSASLVSDQDVFDAIADGTVTFAQGTVMYMDGTIKEITPLEVPGAFSGSKYIEYARGLKPVLDELFEPYNVKFIQCANQSTSCFYTNARAIKTPEDLQGLSVRASGKWIGDTVTGWGGAPTSVSLSDLPTAVERNTIDVVYSATTVYGPWKFYEVTDYVTFTDFSGSWAGVIMSGDAWNALNDAQKEAVEKAGEDFVLFANDAINKERDDLIKMVTDMGKDVTILDEAGTEAFEGSTEKLLAEAVEIGGEGAAKLYEALQAL